MENQTIFISRETIKKTETFKKLSRIQQDLTLNRVNVSHIQNGVNVVKNIGFEKWESQCQFTWNNKEIVKEITNNL